MSLSSSQRAGPSTRPRHLRMSSSTSLPPPPSSSQADFDSTDLLDSLSEITLDSNLDQLSTSSATLFSRRVSPSLSPIQPSSHTSSELDLSARLSASRPFRPLYPLREPGQMTAQRTQRLRARTAAIILSIPATCEDAIDEPEPNGIIEAPPGVHASKLRRVAGIRDLRRAFRDDRPNIFSPNSLGLSKASYELGSLVNSTVHLSPLTPRSSLRTLVEFGRRQSSGDLKTLCGSTVSSATITSRFTAKIRSASASWSSRNHLPTDTSQPITPIKHSIQSPSKAQLHQYISLYQDVHPPLSPTDGVWSCAKISQSAVKRAARRGHAPRRVFSHPIAVLSPSRQVSSD